MFRAGRTYYLTFFVGGTEGSRTQLAKVVSVNLPLVLFRDEGGGETIVNVHSAAFVGAKVAEEPDG